MNCSDDEEIVDQFEDSPGGIFLLKKAKASTCRNRPGTRTNAVRNARVSYNFPNRSYDQRHRSIQISSGTDGEKMIDKSLRSFRCGELRHIWRQCHLPAQRTLACGTRANSEPRSANVSTEEPAEMTDGDSLSNGSHRKSTKSCPERVTSEECLDGETHSR